MAAGKERGDLGQGGGGVVEISLFENDTLIGWTAPTDLTSEQWGDFGQRIKQAEGSLNWIVGDWLLAHRGEWGDIYTEAMELTDWTWDKLKDCKMVSSSFNLETRVSKLSWTTHREIAKRGGDSKQAYLEQASAEGLSSRQAIAMIEASKKPEYPTPPNYPVSTCPMCNQMYDNTTFQNCPYCYKKRHNLRPGVIDYLPELVNEDVQLTDNWAQPESTSELLPNNGPVVTKNTGDNEWYTPKGIITAARRVMGQIDLDPASSEAANKVIQATHFFDIESDGLSQEWRGTVWLNPPYASDLIGRFCEKLETSFLSGGVTEAITLTNNATETRWFQKVATQAAAACFPLGRITFWHPKKVSVSVPLQGQAILYLGGNEERFIEEFKKFGLVMQVKI